jgi:hypothetical protein
LDILTLDFQPWSVLEFDFEKGEGEGERGVPCRLLDDALRDVGTVKEKSRSSSSERLGGRGSDGDR